MNHIFNSANTGGSNDSRSDQNHDGIPEHDLYYFLHLRGDRYYTAFFAEFTDELAQQFVSSYVRPTSEQKPIQVSKWGHRFVITPNEPLYLLYFLNDLYSQALDYAGDYNVTRINSGDKHILAGGLAIVPTFWTKDVETQLDFKLADKVYKNQKGVWVPRDN